MEAPPADMTSKFDTWIHRAIYGKSVGQVPPKAAENTAGSLEAENRYWRTKDYVILKPLRTDSILERFTRYYLGWFLQVRSRSSCLILLVRLITQEYPPVPSTWSVYYFSRHKVERIKDWLAFPLGCLFLVGPALLFHYICDGNRRLAILLSFIIGLSLVVQIFMGTSRRQTLGVALAYTGVMSILLSSATQDNCDLVGDT
jgi:hypothetical protein